MQTLDAARRFIRPAAGIAIAAVTLGVCVLGFLYMEQARDSWWQQTRASVSDRLNLLATDLQGRIGADVQLVRGLVAVVSADPSIDAERFHRIGSELLSGRPEARMIAAAPNRVISMVYPEEGNQEALGYEFSEEMLGPDLLKFGAHRIALRGPMQSHLDGEVFSARAPVFVGTDQSFWGLVVLLIDVPELFRIAGLDDSDLAIDVAVDTTGANGSGPAIFGDRSLFSSEPVLTSVRVPDGTWRLAATPHGGWPAPPEFWRLKAAFVALWAVLVALIVFSARVAEVRQRQISIIRSREAELSQLSWRLEFALASSNIGVWDVDLETDEMFWDDRTKALFGWEGDSRAYYGLADWVAVLHPDDRARAVAEAEIAAHGTGRFSSKYRILLPNGVVRHIRDVARVHTDAHGSRRLVGLMWDITEEVRRQEELELKRVEAEAATTAKSRFLASMSHEIRTPMSGVLGVLGLMLDDPLPPHQRERARIALASAESLLEILNDILDFSKLEAAEVILGEEPVEIRSLIASIMELMSAVATRKGLHIGHTVSAAVPRYVLGDPVRLRQIATNFLSNATKFTERGEIILRVDYFDGPKGGTLSIEVEDTGIGVALEQQEAIFQRFIQADDSLARRAGGTGLGLAISSQLAELMGGRVALRSVPGMGSTFRLEVPSRPAEPAPAAEPAPHAPQISRQLRVLLAEDHATNQYVIGAYLRCAGHQVTLVENGVDAVSAAESGEFDVVLMDVQMPVMDGLAAAAAIRRLDGPAGAVPILALTASAMPGDREACLAAGMDGHLTKPITAKSLSAALRTLVLETRGQNERRTGTSD